MSSIIKSGSAPSNTADGKYFLQTDQACYAELKRGRTYIMTAQEEAKVSHYVIITNADFTVTFNGDSDLVQVGRANNAIVMNVHRACRIDFTQGGNLEFKEGTAEFSSRIEMGVNASGNVLVASSLPQQGDFAGQICSLTTGATYVWTGSQWSSTAGVSTLPSVSYAGLTLMSAGPNTWVAQTIPAWRTLKSSGTGVSGKWAVWKILKVLSTEPGPLHFGFDIQFGTHVKSSRKAHVDVFSNSRTFDSTNTVVFETPSGQAYSSSMLSPVHLRVYSTADAELCIAILADGNYAIRASIFDFITNDSVEYYGTSSGQITESTTDVESETGYTLSTMKYFTSVPVSTAANQMLVSDGNGGWSTEGVLPARFRNYNSNWNGTEILIPPSTTHYYKIATTNPATSSENEPFHIGGFIQIGRHNLATNRGMWSVTGYRGSQTTPTAAVRMSVTLEQAPGVTNQESSYIGNDLVIGCVVENNTDGSQNIYLTLTNHRAYYDPVRWTCWVVNSDEDVIVNRGVIAKVDSVTPAQSCTATAYKPVPMPTTADNGKVLKVVNGVPAWTSA